MTIYPLPVYISIHRTCIVSIIQYRIIHGLVCHAPYSHTMYSSICDIHNFILFLCTHYYYTYCVHTLCSQSCTYISTSNTIYAHMHLLIHIASLIPCTCICTLYPCIYHTYIITRIYASYISYTHMYISL